MPTPAIGTTITYTNVTNEFTLSINPPSRAIGADFRFAGGTYTPASPAIPTGATSAIRLSGDLGGRTKAGGGLAPLYAFDNFLFTSSNVTGPNGPTLAQFTSIPATPGGLGQPLYTLDMYTNVTTQAFYPTYWSLYLSQAGYQQWTVPSTNVYSVIACGAPGGVHQQGAIGTATNTNANGGGYGAVVAGAFNFTRGQNLIITIGQMGTCTFSNLLPATTYYQGKGGGGATTIVDAANTAIPILVAAGGGGQKISSAGAASWAGGRGNRAYSFITATGSTSAAGTDGQPGSSGAAAGFSVNGGGTTAAQSWANGSTGGTNADTLPTCGFRCPGGFGGGGSGGWVAGSQSKGGGGGGWIGGNGSQGQYAVSTTQANAGGGGGVSYCLSSTSPNVSCSPIYLGGCNQTNAATYGTLMPQVQNGCCWIKLMVPRATLLPLITFTDCGTATTAGTGGTIGPPTLANRASAYTDANLTATLCPYWFGHCNGYHAWCVPRTGVYEISAAGGGGDYSTGGANAGGRGRIITARYSLSLGDILIIQVGTRAYNSAVPTGQGGGGGLTSVSLNGISGAWNGCSGNPVSVVYPGYPLLVASAGNGGSTGGIGLDASATDITGGFGVAVSGTPQVAAQNSGTASGNNMYAQVSGRSGSWYRTGVPNGASYDDIYPGNAFNAAGNGGGWGGGGRGSTTAAINGGGGGWVAGGGSNNYTGGPSQSYYWSGTYYVAGSYSAGYNTRPPISPAAGTSVGSGYVTIQGIS